MFALRLKELREKAGFSQAVLARKLGVRQSTVGMWENGRNKPQNSKLEMMASIFHVSTDYLLGRADEPLPPGIIPISSIRHQRIPLIGSVAAGEPIYDQEDVGVYVDSPVDADAAITIRGDSMKPTYQDGDVVYIKCRPDVPEGAVAVVFLDDEATIKHVYKRPTGLTLISDNPAHPPIMAEFEDYDRVRVFGVPVGFTRIYKPDPLKKVKKGF